MTLTGRFNFRKTWFGGLTLEVEEEVKPLFGSAEKLKRRWRRATLMDLAQPEMRSLIDLRFQPQFLARTPNRPATAPLSRAANGAGEELRETSPPPPESGPDASPYRMTH